MRIVVLDGYALNPGDLDWNELKGLGDLSVYDRTPKEKIFERAKEAEIILTNKTLIDKEIIKCLNKLKYIGVLATGYNVVDLDEAKNRNIIVTNVPAYGTDSVAQLVFAYIFEFTNRVKLHSDSVKGGEWCRNIDFCYWKAPIIELSNKTIGIIGYGNIGKRVADIANAFKMKVLVSSRRMNLDNGNNNFKFAELDELYKQSDFISVHCPLTESTKGMINKAAIELMKKTAFIINTSRGPVINEKDLAEALNSGRIAGAALDVLSIEPPTIDNVLLEAKNCIITPHIAWASKEARWRLMHTATENVKSFILGTPQNIVNK